MSERVEQHTLVASDDLPEFCEAIAEFGRRRFIEGEQAAIESLRDGYATYLAAASGALAVSDPDTAEALRGLRRILEGRES